MYSNRNSFLSNIPPVTKNLILINIVVLVLTFIVKSVFHQDLVTEYLALYYPGSTKFMFHQIITHMFMHANITHLFFNMFALYMFGRILEQVWGGKRFLIYYFITGLGAMALHTFVNYLQISSLQNQLTAILNSPSPELFADWVRSNFPYYFDQIYEKLIAPWTANPNNTEFITVAQRFGQDLITFDMNIPTVGASGAVFGVLLAFGMLFPNTELMLLFPPIPIKAKYFVLGYGAIEIYLALNMPGDGVAHFAHLGGMLFGFVLIKMWNKRRNTFY